MTFIRVFEHKSSKIDDVQQFFFSMINDEWDSTVADIFLDLVDHVSGSDIVTLLSSSQLIKKQIDATPTDDVLTSNLLRQQRNEIIDNATVIMKSIFDF